MVDAMFRLMRADIRPPNSIAPAGAIDDVPAESAISPSEPERIASATFLTTQVDFSKAGDLMVFIDDAQLLALDEMMAEEGYLDGSRMAAVFNMLRPKDLIWPYVVNNYLLGKQPFPFDLLYWNSDSTRLPRAETLLNIAAEHKVSLDWLLGLSQDEGVTGEIRASLEIEEGQSDFDRTLLARAITLVESSRPDHQRAAQELLLELTPKAGHAVRVGISGVPGVGKSTFIEAMGSTLTSRGHRVAVLAVDPSSTRTRGSILGDKTRMPRLAVDPHAFVRPSPSAARLACCSPMVTTFPSMGLPRLG